MSKTREVDQFGNVSFTIGQRVIGRILKTGSSSYQVERFPFDSYAPVRSVKAGMDWLARYGA